MPLVTCPDCHQPVSDQAAACIHCGRPLHNAPPPVDLATGVKQGNQRSKWRYEAGNALGIIGVVVGLVLMVASVPLGVVVVVVSGGFGLWLAYGS
jgi:hypothetical protein